MNKLLTRFSFHLGRVKEVNKRSARREKTKDDGVSSL